MRSNALLWLLPVLAAAPIAAQGFEGTITANMPVIGNGATVTYHIKGDKTATTMALGSNAGPMAGKEMHMILDRTTMTSTILIATEMLGGKGIKVVTDLSKPPAGAKSNPTIKDLGTSDVIAGMKCNNFEVTDGKTVTHLCMSRDLGIFSLPGGGPMGGGGAQSSGWTAIFATHPGFPLRVADANGKIIIEVTSVQRGTVSPSEFVIPDGYMDMGGMGRMGGRGGGR